MALGFVMSVCCVVLNEKSYCFMSGISKLYNPWTKSGMLPVFVNKMLWIVYDCSCATSCDRGLIDCKVYIFCLAIYRKSLWTPILYHTVSLTYLPPPPCFPWDRDPQAILVVEVIWKTYHLAFLVVFHQVCWSCRTDLELGLIFGFSAKGDQCNGRYFFS